MNERNEENRVPSSYLEILASTPSRMATNWQTGKTGINIQFKNHNVYVPVLKFFYLLNGCNKAQLIYSRTFATSSWIMSFTLSSISSSIWEWNCFCKNEENFQQTSIFFFCCNLQNVFVFYSKCSHCHRLIFYLLAHLHCAQFSWLVLGIHHHIEHGA